MKNWNIGEQSSEVTNEIKKGNQEVFKCFFDYYKNDIYTYAFRFLKEKELAEETVQEVFIKVWTNRALLDSSKCLKAFLYTIARNHIFNQLKTLAHQKKLRGHFSERDPGKNEPVEEFIFHKELEFAYEKAISLLPTQRKRIFQMSRNDELSHFEIARELNISKNTVKDQIVKASRFVRDYIIHFNKS